MSRPKTRVQEALRDLRKRLNLTQYKLSAALNVGPISVARWETTRPPSGYSLLRLADFARANRQLEIAEVFQTALYLEDPARNLFLGFKPQPAALSALEEIRSIRVGLGGEYLKVLRALERAHARMLEVFSPENENYREWQRTHQELKWEIEDEEKRQKKKG